MRRMLRAAFAPGHGGAMALGGKAMGHAGLVGPAAEAVDLVEAVGIVPGEPIAQAAFEDVTGETRREGAAEEGIAPAREHVPRLPDIRRDDELHVLSLEGLAAHDDIAA